MKSASHSVSLHVLLAVMAIAAGTPAARAAEVWHFLDYWHFHRADNVELCQGQAVWQKDKTYVDPLRAKINDHLNSWATVWQDRASGKWRMVYSAKWTPLTLMAAESDDGLDWQPMACPDIQPTGEKLAPHHIFTLPGGSGGGVYLDPEARDGYPMNSVGYKWLTAVYQGGQKRLWSEYATELYLRLSAKARREGWLNKLRYLLYERGINESDARHFRGFRGVLLQGRIAADGKSMNPHIAAVQ